MTMTWIITILIIAAIGWWFYKYSRPDVFAKGIAKAQLDSLYAVRKKLPELQGYELYIKAISVRPGYALEDAENLVARVRKGNKAAKFRDVVWELVYHEYTKKVGNLPLGADAQTRIKEAEKVAIMMKVVGEVIPKEL